MVCGKLDEKQKDVKMKKQILKNALAVGFVFASAKTFSQELNVEKPVEENYYFQCANKVGDTIKVAAVDYSRVGTDKISIQRNGIETKYFANHTFENSTSIQKYIYHSFYLTADLLELSIVTQSEWVPGTSTCGRGSCRGSGDQLIQKTTALLKLKEHETFFDCL